MSRRRVCTFPHCVTILLSSNPGPRCFTHTPDLVELQRSGKHVATPHNAVDRMSRTFLDGIEKTYLLSAAEVKAFYTGAWLGDGS